MHSNHRQLSIRARALPFDRLIAFVVGAVLSTAARASGPPAQPMLHLVDGRSTGGEIQASTRPGILRWRAASSGSPSDFAWNEVKAIEWLPPDARPKPVGDFCFELAAGDKLFGSLLALGEQRAELEVLRLGRIHLQRSNIYRVYRWRDGADSIYLGPNGLVGWHEPAGHQNWREDSG